MKLLHNLPKNPLLGIVRKFQSDRDTEHPCNHSNLLSCLSATGTRGKGETLTEITLSSMHGNTYNRFEYISCFPPVGLNNCPLFVLWCYQLWICFSLREKMDVWREIVWKMSIAWVSVSVWDLAAVLMPPCTFFSASFLVDDYGGCCGNCTWKFWQQFGCKFRRVISTRLPQLQSNQVHLH